MAKTAPDPNVLYREEYETLMEALAVSSLRKPLENYLNARRRGAGETMLTPSLTLDQIQIIRGKAQAFSELLAMCLSAKAIHSENEGD